VKLLAAKAQAQGVSAEHYARRVLEQDLRADALQESISQQAISEAIREIWADMPAEVRAKLPRDGARSITTFTDFRKESLEGSFRGYSLLGRADEPGRFEVLGCDGH